MRILRLTRHPASSEQLSELRRIFGGVEVTDISETVPDVARVKELIALHDAEVLEAVLPLALLSRCLDPHRGVAIPVVRAHMQRTLLAHGRLAFTFAYYERMMRIEVVAERL